MASGIAGTSMIFASLVFHCAPKIADPSSVIRSTVHMDGSDGAIAGCGAAKGRTGVAAMMTGGATRLRCVGIAAPLMWPPAMYAFVGGSCVGSRSFIYQYRVFEAGQLASALGLAMKAIGVDPNEASCHVRERLGDGTYFERRVGLREIETICDVARQPFILLAKTTAEGNFALSIGPNSASTFQLTIEAATVQILNDARATLERALQLQESQESLYDPFSGNTHRLIAEA